MRCANCNCDRDHKKEDFIIKNTLDCNADLINRLAKLKEDNVRLENAIIEIGLIAGRYLNKERQDESEGAKIIRQ